MKKKVKGILLVVLTALATLFIFAGCSFGESLNDILTKNNLTAQVTYYVNAEGAEFTPNTAKQKDLYYQSGSTAINIGKVSNLGVKNEGFVFAGWYHVDKDSEGNLVTTGEYEDSQGEKHYLYKLAEEVDFSKKLQDGDHWYVAAKWTTAAKLRVELVFDDAETELPLDMDSYTNPQALDQDLLYGKESVKSGDVVIARSYDSNDEVLELDYDILQFKDYSYTFVEYYLDKECTEIVEFPLKKQEEGDQVIYAKCIAGDWTIVREADQVKDIFAYNSARYHYWLTRDLDCTGITATAADNYSAEIQGNGFTLSNLTISSTSGDTRSMFGNIKASAKIENLAFENVTLTATKVLNSIYAYFVFASMENGATVTNVSIQGEFIITKDESFVVINLGTDYTSCLFGGFDKDADYNGGFTVVGDPSEFIKQQTA